MKLKYKNYPLYLTLLLMPIYCSAIEYVGKGCTTALWIDEDCDGFVIGGKDGVIIPPTIQNPPIAAPAVPLPPSLDADANDNDPALNTTQSVINRYGDLTNMQNLKNYLRDLGYTHPINNIFFISMQGDNATAQINDLNHPYLNRPVPQCSPQCCSGPCIEPVIHPGDVVFYRGGNYPYDLNTQASGYPRWDALQGTDSQPILLMPFPGERVSFRNSYGGFGFVRGSRYVIVDGFEFDGQYQPGLFARQVVNFDQTPIDHCTIKNVDIRNGGRWGIFGSLLQARDYITLDHVVIHHIGDEHCLYHNDGAGLPEATEDRGWVIKNSLFYFSGRHGIHWRGGQDFVFENNIFHTTGLNGVEIKNGARNGIVRNNLFMNTQRPPVSLFEDNDAQHINNGIDNIVFENNIFHSKNGSNGMNPDGSNGPCVTIEHWTNPPRLFTNIKFFNNIFYSEGQASIWFYKSFDVPNVTLENNIFYKNTPGLTGMGVCDWTDGTHDLMANFGVCSPQGAVFHQGYLWNFQTMMDPVRRPQFSNNLFANPNFVDVNTQYTFNRTPWLFNLESTAGSPAIDFANPAYATTSDLRGHPRVGRPDAGAYEFSLPSPNSAPVVDAGPGQSITYPVNQVTLAGLVSDDGLPNPPAQVFPQWTKKSGVGNVAFSDSSNPNTTATFSSPGIYDLRLSATDGALFASDIVRITVIDPNVGQNGNNPPGGQQASFGETRFNTCLDPNNITQRRSIPICLNIGNSAQDSSGTVEIYSKSGQKVRSLFSGVLSGGETRFIWDTKNDDGETQSSGIYYTVYTQNGKTLAKAKIPLLR